MIYFLMIAGIIAFDQIVKHLVSDTMITGQSIPVIDNIFHITYIQNTGAAFSILQGHKVILIIVPMVIMIAAAVLLFVKKSSWHPALNVSIAFICAGGIGNMIDRALRGYVVDMFDFRVFPVFNVADIFVCTGCALMVLYILFIDGRNKEKRK